MLWADVFLGVAASVFLVLEVWAIRNHTPGDTFSERTRVWFRTDTHAGKVAFIVLMVAAPVWYIAHILI